MKPGYLRQSLRNGLPFGCLFGLLLGGGMALTIIVGGMMGYCEGASDCGDGIGSDLALAMPVFLIATITVWSLCSLLKSRLESHLSPLALNTALLAFVIALAWFGLAPLLQLVLAMKA
jgi:ABC-type dipeptide/oligopeptide/nickel transport system permease subunit